MKLSRIEDILESLQICEDFNSRLDSFWNSLPKEKRKEIKELCYDYLAPNGVITDVFSIIADVFSILKIPVNPS